MKKAKKNIEIIIIFIFSSLTEKEFFCINITKKELELLGSPEITEIKGIIAPKLSNSNSDPINIKKIIKVNEFFLYPKSKNKTFLIIYLNHYIHYYLMNLTELYLYLNFSAFFKRDIALLE